MNGRALDNDSDAVLSPVYRRPKDDKSNVWKHRSSNPHHKFGTNPPKTTLPARAKPPPPQKRKSKTRVRRANAQSGILSPSAIAKIRGRRETGFHNFNPRPSFQEDVRTTVTTNPTIDDVLGDNVSAFLDNLLKEESLIDDDDCKSDDHKTPERERTIIKEENIVDNITTIFKYVRQLGAGASCRVLKAYHLKNQGMYALKEMSKADPRNHTSFLKERQLLRKFGGIQSFNDFVFI